MDDVLLSQSTNSWKPGFPMLHPKSGIASTVVNISNLKHPVCIVLFSQIKYFQALHLFLFFLKHNFEVSKTNAEYFDSLNKCTCLKNFSCII